MADNPFAKKFDKKKGDKGEEKEGGHKMPNGEMMHGRGAERPSGKGKAAKGNPFAKKFDGKHQPPKRRGRKRPARKGKLQKFGQKD